MIFKTYEINVDLINDTSTTSAVRFSQNDINSAKFLLNITKLREELDLSQAKSVRMSFRKPDGTRVFQNDCQPINVMKGKYQIVLKTQTLTAVGNVIAQIHIEEEDRTIDTQKFLFLVNESLASDEAIESTNEFGFMQKYVEASEKLEGVDIPALVASKEIAEQAKAAAEQNANQIGILSENITDIKTTADEALPKTGGTMTGELVLDGGALMRFKGFGTDPDWAFRRDDANDGFVIVPRKSDNSDWDWSKQIEFRPDNFIVNGKSNLLKKTGDVMTGYLEFDVTNGEKVIRSKDDTGSLSGISFKNSQIIMYDFGKNRPVWYYDSDTGVFNMQADTNLVSKNKDGQANLVLTADATNFDTNRTPQANRRGNTVTLSGAIKLNANAEGFIVTTLPVDMRPVVDIIQTVLNTDGSVSTIEISASGGYVIFPAKGKDIFLQMTYIVN